MNEDIRRLRAALLTAAHALRDSGQPEAEQRCYEAINASRSSGAPSTVWEVHSKTISTLFTTKAAAEAFVSSFSASVGGGMFISERHVLAAPESAPTGNENVADAGPVGNVDVSAEIKVQPEFQGATLAPGAIGLPSSYPPVKRK